MPAAQGVVGPVIAGDGAIPPGGLRIGRLGDAIVSELHGRFYEQNYRGNLFAAGLTTVLSIAAATFAIATTGATATPILGVYNPPGSGKNLVILQAALNLIVTAATCTGPGPLYWMVSTGNTAPITTAATPWNRSTLTQTGSVAKNVSGVALTGMTGTLAVLFGSALGTGPNANFSFVGTAVGAMPSGNSSVENFDGSLIVPPGAVLALMAGGTPVAIAAGGVLLWEEVQVA